MSSEPESNKERKKSAHWSETDTVILINTLMQHKDSGRTVDNGFKPSVWRIASEALHGVEHVGGPKTPDACKSRWQRVSQNLGLTDVSFKEITKRQRRWNSILGSRGTKAPAG